MICVSLDHPQDNMQAGNMQLPVDVRAALKSRCDIPACIAIGQILADRAREADVYTASYTPRDRDKFEGKIRAVVQSLIDSGIDVKIYLD